MERLIVGLARTAIASSLPKQQLVHPTHPPLSLYGRKSHQLHATHDRILAHMFSINNSKLEPEKLCSARQQVGLVRSRKAAT